MAIIKPRICAVITKDELLPVKTIEAAVDLYEVRIDLICDGWQRVARHLNKPWIACNRSSAAGGMWMGGEDTRLQQLQEAVSLGATIVDLEMETENLSQVIETFRTGKVKCLVSYHDHVHTPPSYRLHAIIQQQIDAGADICKVVTTAESFADNMTLLELIRENPKVRIVAFAMGPLGAPSRILCPLAGGDFTYATIETGKESAPGQLTVEDLTKIYGMLHLGK